MAMMARSPLRRSWQKATCSCPWLTLGSRAAGEGNTFVTVVTPFAFWWVRVTCTNRRPGGLGWGRPGSDTIAAGERPRLRPLGRRHHLHLPLADPAAVLARAGPAALHRPAPGFHRVRGGPGRRCGAGLRLLAGPGVLAAGVPPVLYL